ncbi:MAG: hypothetical protein HC804_01460 [Anaerolineae bacterium]|nr:hypothetical protein [Anaerolineae bacterium]
MNGGVGRYECPDDPVGSLPDSFVKISAGYRTREGGFTTEDRASGVIVASNAILTHHHFYSDNVTPETLESVILRSADGQRITARGEFSVISGSELGGMHNGLTLIVFEDDFSGGSVAPMSGAGAHLNGEDAQQSVRIGAKPGLYNTQIIDGADEFEFNNNPFPGILVAPDQTVRGDSGAPLYVDGSVVGVNNQGDGQYGAITNIPLIQYLINKVTEDLRGSNHGAQ